MSRILVLLVAGALSACASTQGSQAKSQLRTIQKETRWQELYERGRAFAAVGDFTRAEEYFAAALEGGGDRQKLIPLILFCCMQDGRYLLAAQYAEEHLEKSPSDDRTRFVLGSIYAGLGQTGPAQRELERVVANKPDQAEAHYALGRVLWDGKKSYAAADHQFREYLRLTPQGPHAAEAKEHLLQALPEPTPAAKTGPTTSQIPQPLPPLNRSESLPAGSPP